MEDSRLRARVEWSSAVPVLEAWSENVWIASAPHAMLGLDAFLGV